MTGEHEFVADAPVEETDPHETLERIGKRSNAMKILAACVVGLILFGAGGATWIGSLETRVRTDQVAATLRGEIEKSKQDCDKRLRAVEEWRRAADERDGWIMRSLDSIGRKLDARLTPPPLPPLDGLKGTP